MEACTAVEREVDRVLSKFGSIKDHAERVLADLVQYVDGLRQEFANAPPDHEPTPCQIMLLAQANAKIKETVQRLTADHRDLHSTVSKVGKAIDRNFISDFAATSREDVFGSPDKVQLLNQVICNHFLRQGMQEVADEFAKEANTQTQNNVREPFLELNHILDCLKVHNIEPALAWAISHHDELQSHSSSLEFKLHRLRYISLLQQGPEKQMEAIQYARTHFKQFIVRHEKDIQMLMGMLLFVPNGIASSPYSFLLDSELWVEISDTFTKDACSLLGLSVDSPLSVCINAGCSALPALLSIKQVMLQRHVTGIWHGKDELPIEIDLGQENRYHSMFACPILRQQSTESNPPMRLVCGHIISRDALNKLCNSNKLKCPYCPLEQSPADAKQVYF